MKLIWLQNQKINCVDCDKEIMRTCPNKKRCEECCLIKSNQNAVFYKECHRQENRDRAKEWYWKNRDYKRNKSREYTRNRNKI